jgi:hypothetical protein
MGASRASVTRDGVVPERNHRLVDRERRFPVVFIHMREPNQKVEVGVLDEVRVRVKPSGKGAAC